MSRLLPRGAEPEEGLVSCPLSELGWGVRGGEAEAPQGAWHSPPDLQGCREAFSGFLGTTRPRVSAVPVCAV